MVVFDVDGTVVAADGTCSDRTKRSIERLRQAGVTLAYATGRPVAALHETINAVGQLDFAVCDNGGSVIDLTTNEFLYSEQIPGPSVHTLVQDVRAAVPGVGVAGASGRTWVEEDGFDRRLPARLSPIGLVDDALAALGDPTPGAEGLSFFHDNYDDDLPALATIVRSLSDERCAVDVGGIAVIDVSPVGITKATGLQWLTDRLGLVADDVLAFGDGLNDLDMFGWVGTSVAMGLNCPAQLLAAADAVTDSVDEDGVANYLDGLFAP